MLKSSRARVPQLPSVFAGPISENSAPGGWKGPGATEAAAAGRPNPFLSSKPLLSSLWPRALPVSSLASVPSPALLPASCPTTSLETHVPRHSISRAPFFSLGTLSLAILPHPQGLILHLFAGDAHTDLQPQFLSRHLCIWVQPPSRSHRIPAPSISMVSLLFHLLPCRPRLLLGLPSPPGTWLT